MTPLAAVDPARVTPGLAGFLVTLALAVATWLLLRSMIRHLRRVDFVEEPDAPDEGGGEADDEGRADEGRAG